MPLASNVADADRSPEGPSVAELLARRGTAYAEHMQAVQETRDALRRRAEDVEGFLAERAAGSMPPIRSTCVTRTCSQPSRQATIVIISALPTR
jgi:hypothetical protein